MQILMMSRANSGDKKLALIGFSSQTREIIPRLEIEFEVFINDEYFDKISAKPMNSKKLSEFDPQLYLALVTIGNPVDRKKIVERLPSNTEFYTFIDKDASIFSGDVRIGSGSIICAGSKLTTNVIVGMHSHINLNCTICHDVVTGDFFTTAPGVNVSGNCTIGSNVYIGTNSSVKQRVSICDNVVIGMQSGVNKSITEPGKYVGSPIRFLKDGVNPF
jgi:sugar O-acyltransferase (sialic acid O-acetyltransferase NeuD family)